MPGDVVSGTVYHIVIVNMNKSIVLLVVRRRLELWVDGLHALHERVALLLQLAARAVLARVQPLAVRRVDGLRRRRPAGRRGVSASPSRSETSFARARHTVVSL